MRRALALLISCGFACIATAQNETPSPSPAPTGDPMVYGQYPIAYHEIIERWLGTTLVDPKSAVIEWGEAPKASEYKTQKGEKFVGYLVDFKVNARNQFGTSTGKQKYRVIIRNGEVLWAGHPPD